LDTSDLIFPVVIQQMCCRKICSLQGLRCRHSPFGIVGELIRLTAVWSCGRGGATAKDNGNTGGQRLLKSLFG
jgi:hypothetical protein